MGKIKDTFAAVTAGTVAVQVLAESSGGRDLAHVYNAGTATVYLGINTSGTANGYPLEPASEFIYNGGPALFAITAAVNVELRVHDSQ